MHSVQISPFRRRQVQTSDVYGMHIHQLIKRMEGNEEAACIMFLVFFRLEVPHQNLRGRLHGRRENFGLSQLDLVRWDPASKDI